MVSPLSIDHHSATFIIVYDNVFDKVAKPDMVQNSGQDLTNFISPLFYTGIIRKICQVSPEY